MAADRADNATPWAAPSSRRVLVAPESGVTLKGVGPSLRRYSLVLKIASGGMGAVYLGFQTGAAGFRRPVAIKRAHAHLAEDPDFRRMIINEARLASLVRHPNVVSVCDVDDVDGELFLVMEYVEGATLAELMTGERPLPLRLTLRIISDACRGLDALHSAVDDRGQPLGLVHRDISPQNILVGIDGVARIADFGIAKAYEGTTSGLLRGKPAYMAPEYITSGIASRASDVFGLGIVAWECITRRRLFRVGTDIETLERVRHVTIPPASAFDPNLPSSVEGAIMKALARSVDERYQTAREFGQALEAMGGESGVFARAESVGEHVQAIVREKLELRRQALMEETPAQPRAVDVPAKVGAPDGTMTETPLSQHGPIRQEGRPLGLPVAIGVVLFAAAFAFTMLRTSSAPTERRLPTAAPQAEPSNEPVQRKEAQQVAPPPLATSVEPTPPARPTAEAVKPTITPPPTPRPTLPPAKTGESLLVAVAPLPVPELAPPPAVTASAALRAPPAEAPPKPVQAATAAPSLVDAPPSEAPDNPYK